MRNGAKHLTYANVVSTLSLFLVLAGGAAYAADTVFSTDIVDGEVKAVDIDTNAVNSQEIRNNQVRSADVRDDTLSGGGLASSDLAAGAVTAADVAGESLTGDEVADESLTVSDIADESLTGDVVAFNSLTGSDIHEGSLGNVPSATKLLGDHALRRIQFHATNGVGASGSGGIGAQPGLGVKFDCDGATGDLELTFASGVDNASLAVSDDDSYFDVEDFDIADGDVDILSPLGGDSDEVVNFVYVDGAGFGPHKVVSGQFHVLDDAPAGTVSECVVAGYAMHST